MIVEWLLELSAGFLEWVGSLFPPVDVPEWLANPFFGFSWIINSAAGWGAWINVGVVSAVAVFVLGVYVVTAGVKLVRAIVAHLPFIGGNG